MSGDKDEFDPSDWLIGQFDETDEVEKLPEKQPDAKQPPVQPPAGGGFDWNLRPGSAAPPAPSPVPPPVDVPTEAMSLEDVEAAQKPVVPVEDQATQAFVVPKWEPAPHPVPAPQPVPPPVYPPAEPTSALDALFHENRFQEYEEPGAVPAAAPLIGVDGVAQPSAAQPKAPHAPLSTAQKVLIGVAGGLIVVLVLIALFLLGQKLGAASAVSPVTPVKGASSAVPKPASGSGPVAPGTYVWNQLNGGECLQPFTNSFATKFTVVDCAQSHVAQLVFKGTLPDASGTAYPSGTQLAAELQPLCTSSTAIDYSAAKAVTDLQLSYAYPATEDDWNKGDRTYYCFVNRSSGGTLTGSLAPSK